MKVKTAELTASALNLMVAQCMGKNVYLDEGFVVFKNMWGEFRYEPASNWAQGGPIIEQEIIHLNESKAVWMATTVRGGIPDAKAFGPTALVAAMRCYVASKLGDEVEIPEDLV